MGTTIWLFLSAVLAAHPQSTASPLSPPPTEEAAQLLSNRLLIVSTKTIAEHGNRLDIKLRSGDHIKVPIGDANNRATQIVRAALRSQSRSLDLPAPEQVVVLNVANLTNVDKHGRLTVTLASGASIVCRDEDVRPDPQLTFLRTILTEHIYKAATTPAGPPVFEGFEGLQLASERPAPQTAANPQTDAVAADQSFGPSLQFDAKGADFSEWLRRFRVQVYRNWLIPYAAMNLHGHVVLRFTVHRDGAVTDVTVLQPSQVEAFTKSAFNAIKGSNPTVPLPQEYPDESMVMTLIFYYNEQPAK